MSIVLLSINFIIANEKLRADEIVQKSLDSIGSKSKRDEIKNLIIMSDVEFISKGSTIPINGKAVFASEDYKNLWGMNLTSNDYPQDKFAFDGEKIQVAHTIPGSYSILGDFIVTYNQLLKEGLLGGVLFSSWALDDLQKREAKVSTAGTKKIGKIETYVIEFAPKGAFDLEVKMYFDKSNFRHVRTEYFRFVAASQALSIDTAVRQSSDRFQVIEEFADFQNMGGLTLPGSYRINYEYTNTSPVSSPNRKSKQVEWKFKVTSFSYNQKLEASSFNISTN